MTCSFFKSARDKRATDVIYNVVDRLQLGFAMGRTLRFWPVSGWKGKGDCDVSVARGESTEAIENAVMRVT